VIQTNRRIVIDANILIRAVLGKKVRELIQNNATRVLFFTPDTCDEDALKYLPILFEKRKLSYENE
jgi:predicted nucleic acid-binding protein